MTEPNGLVIDAKDTSSEARFEGVLVLSRDSEQRGRLAGLPDNRRGLDNTTRRGRKASDARKDGITNRDRDGRTARGEDFGHEERVSPGHRKELSGIDIGAAGELCHGGR